MSDLVERLRASRAVWDNAKARPTDDETAAADRIEALEAQIAAADRLAEAANRGLNFIENTEGEMGEPLESGNALRTALAAYRAARVQP